MSITPSTITAVPRMSVAVTAEKVSDCACYPEHGRCLRVPTSQRAKMKLKISAEDPRGATQSGRRYRRASGEPTVMVSTLDRGLTKHVAYRLEMHCTVS